MLPSCSGPRLLLRLPLSDPWLSRPHKKVPVHGQLQAFRPHGHARLQAFRPPKVLRQPAIVGETFSRGSSLGERAAGRLARREKEIVAAEDKTSQFHFWEIDQC